MFLVEVALGSREGRDQCVLWWLRKSASCSESSLGFEQMGERREGERTFQKVARLKQRRGRALVQATKTDRGQGKPCVLAGGMRRPGNAVLPWWLWLGCWPGQPECVEAGTNMACVMGTEGV